tara:strand:+ start:908 stop:1087 length:180 start_codon:yes stop_codon:yes gene_type:complete
MKVPQGLDSTKIRKIVTAIVICENEEAWIEAEKDIRELAKVMSNLKRQVAIYKIEEMEE